jgi:hypothetical protein
MHCENVSSTDARTTRVERARDYLFSLHANLDHRDLAPVAQQLMSSYARLAEKGLPANAVAAAMVAATLNFYTAFDMSQELPMLLRAMADMMEMQTTLS